MAHNLLDLPFFRERGFNESSMAEVVACMSLMKMKKGTVVMEYGDIGDNFYFILNGEVEV